MEDISWLNRRMTTLPSNSHKYFLRLIQHPFARNTIAPIPFKPAYQRDMNAFKKLLTNKTLKRKNLPNLYQNYWNMKNKPVNYWTQRVKTMRKNMPSLQTIPYHRYPKNIMKKTLSALSKPKTLRNRISQTIRKITNKYKTYKSKKDIQKIVKKTSSELQKALNSIQPSMKKYRDKLEKIKEAKKLKTNDITTILQVIRNPFAHNEQRKKYETLKEDRKLSYDNISNISAADAAIKAEYDLYHQLKTYQQTLKPNTRKPLSQKIKDFLKKPFQPLINKYKTRKSLEKALDIHGLRTPLILEEFIRNFRKNNKRGTRQWKNHQISIAKSLLHNYEGTIKRSKNKLFLYFRLDSTIDKDTNMKDHINKILKEDRHRMNELKRNKNSTENDRTSIKQQEFILDLVEKEAKKPTDFEALKKKILKYRDEVLFREG